MKIAIALGLFGSLILLLNQPTASAYLSDSSDIEDPSSLNGESVISVAGNDISILRKKKKNRPAKKQKKAKKSKVPAEPRCSASSPNKPQIIGNMTQRIRPISTPNGRFLRQRCGWHFEPEQGRKLSLKCRIGKNALRNCKKTYLRVNGKKYCGKVSKIEIPESSSLSLKFTSKLTGRSKISCTVSAFNPCPSSWKHFGGSCYWSSIGTAGQRNWTYAAAGCQNISAELVSVHSLEENDFVNATVHDVQLAHWIGLSNVTKDVKWTDGTPVDYIGTLSSTPGQSDTCGTITNGEWGYDVCFANKNYVCKKKRGSS